MAIGKFNMKAEAGQIVKYKRDDMNAPVEVVLFECIRRELLPAYIMSPNALREQPRKWIKFSQGNFG